MGYLSNVWRSIGARLYLALGFSVLLTIVSGSVGVWHFEQAGDSLSRLGRVNSPSLGAALGLSAHSAMIERSARRGVVDPADAGGQVEQALSQADVLLARVGGSPAVDAARDDYRVRLYSLAEVADRAVSLRAEAAGFDARASSYREEISSLPRDSGSVLLSALQAEDLTELDLIWPRMQPSGAPGPLVQGVYGVRAGVLLLHGEASALELELEDSVSLLDASAQVLFSAVQRDSELVLAGSSAGFDRGRVLLTGISVLGILVATLVAWFWVGRGVVVRLGRLSERMKGMARGDIETPVPEVGGDEIGELAGTLEVWRQQALEVRRLNLVEQLYGELREAHDELGRMQDRLVAQEKLAALGELVSGVAHEISNPLNFVKNFSEGSQELCTELMGIVVDYRDGMSEDDRQYLDEVFSDLNDSLVRVQSNGGRALAIVDRMRGLGVSGGEPELADLNQVVMRSAEQGCLNFSGDWPGFSIRPDFDLCPSLVEIPLVVSDFREAVMNLVSNACYAMQLRRESGAYDGYSPRLLVSTALGDGVAEVRVRDNGAGIRDDLVGQIFNPFFTTRDGALGAGLGLPIVADVLRRLGGHVGVDTVPGEYAEFLMEVPLARS